MGIKQVFSIHLKDGTVISFRKPYNYFDKGIITERIENAGEDDIVTIRNGIGEELLIPKKNISFIKISPEETDDDTKEVVS